MLIRLAKCSNPVPGDEIIGFITKGRGVSVHRTDCPNVVHTEEADSRYLEVEWAVGDSGRSSKTFEVDIEISAFDRSGLLNEVMMTVTEMKVPITAVTGRANKEKIAKIEVTIEITSIEHLHQIVKKIKQISDVHAVHRVTN